MFVVFLSVLLSVGYLASNPELTSEPFTEVYVVDENGTTSNYPETLAPGETANVTVGISNQEHQQVTYQLAVRWNGTTTEQRRVTLPAGETAEEPITLQAPSAQGRYRVQFQVVPQNIESDGPPPARLWIQVE